MVIRYCDRCKEQIKSSDTYYHLGSYKRTPAAREGAVVQTEITPFADVCEDCFETILTTETNASEDSGETTDTDPAGGNSSSGTGDDTTEGTTPDTETEDTTQTT